MKAAVYRAHGGPDVLEFAEVPDPAAGPGEILVRTAAVALNRLDLIQRAGPALLPHFRLPHIAGMDFAGVIDAVGDGVTSARLGQRVVVNPSISCGTCALCARGADHLCENKIVIGGSIDGGYGELVAVPATHAHPIPDHVDLIEAASLPTVYSRAWTSLFVSGRLAIGETVLIHAAASGVTIAAVHLAKRAGARVIVTARTDDELDYARCHGADAGINTTETPDIVPAVRELSGGQGVDLVFDHLGPSLFAASIDALRPGGRMVFCGTTTGSVVQLVLPAVYHRDLTLIGSASYTLADFERMLDYCWRADLPSIVDRQLPISEIAAAHELMAADRLRGKLVLVH